MSEALSFWDEPAPPPVPVPKRPYRRGQKLVRAQIRAEHLAQTFNYCLSSALHMALIYALEETAENNVDEDRHQAPATFTSEPHDGFYTYHGSIDTPHVAEFLNMVVQRWLVLNAVRSEL